MSTELQAKTEKLNNLLQDFETTSMLKFLSAMFHHFANRDSFQILKGLHSPFRQLFYVGDICLQVPKSKTLKKAWQYKEWTRDWEQIKQLLIEIEFLYFQEIALAPDDGSEEAFKAIQSVMPTYMNHFFNGSLSYPEQDIERLRHLFIDNPTLITKLRFSADDLVGFYRSVVIITSERMKESLHFVDPAEWEKFTSACVAKGLEDPKQWIAEAPEIFKAYFELIADPGAKQIYSVNEISNASLTAGKAKLILDFLRCNPPQQTDLIFYTQPSRLLSNPIYMLPDGRFLVIHFKQLLASLLIQIESLLLSENREKTLRQRDRNLEEKAVDVLKCYFKDKKYFLHHGYLPDNGSEQDILILSGTLALIIEVKAASFREPMRDPKKAYTRLRQDFKDCIQYGYNQCYRVKHRFMQGDIIDLHDKKGRLLFKLDTNRYSDVFSIIVIQNRLGAIQSDLSWMLQLKEGDDYPWCISIDDLEIFLLALKRKKIGLQELRTFLSARELYHGHVFCSDELELCAYFLHRREKFLESAQREEMITTDMRLTQVFEELYNSGLGFKDEWLFYEKRSGKVMTLFNNSNAVK